MNNNKLVMSYIYVLSKGDGNFKIDFTNELNNRNFNHGDEGQILIQFYTEDKDIFLNMVNYLIDNFEVVDKVENIFKSDMASFLIAIKNCKKKFEYEKDNFIKDDFIKDSKLDFESKEESKDNFGSRVFNCDNKKFEEMEKEDRINKIKSDVEKKLKKSFDELNRLSQEFLLADRRECYVRNIEQLFNNVFMKDEAIQIMKHYFEDDHYRSFNVNVILQKVDYSGFERKLCTISFDEIIKLKQELPKLDILNYAKQQIKTLDQFKIFDKEFMKDNHNGLLNNTKSAKKDRMKIFRYQFIDMKNVRGDLSIEQIISLSQNEKLNDKVYDKYFSNIKKDEVDDISKMYGLISKYQEIKNNLINNPSVSNDMINKYFV